MAESTHSFSWKQAAQNGTHDQALLTNSGNVFEPFDELDALIEEPPDKSNNSMRLSPWLLNFGNFLKPTTILKKDLILPKPSINIVDGYLWLDEEDYTPIEIGWGFPLLGFFAGRFPGKEAVQKMISRWTRKCRVSYHPNGWMIFSFETEADMEFIRTAGPFDAFGIPLVLCHLPKDFRFDSTPEFKFRVWISLPNLPLSLWNPNALGKIATMLGEPVEVDFKTISKNSLAGPRVMVLVDAMKSPVESVNLKLHNGNIFTQSVIYDFYPLFCSSCKRVGHTAENCRVNFTPNRGAPNPPRGSARGNLDTGWQVQNRRNRGRLNQKMPATTREARSTSKGGGGKSIPRHAVVLNQGKEMVNSAPVLSGVSNSHIRFPSPFQSNLKDAEERSRNRADAPISTDHLTIVRTTPNDPCVVTHSPSKSASSSAFHSDDPNQSRLFGMGDKLKENQPNKVVGNTQNETNSVINTIADLRQQVSLTTTLTSNIISNTVVGPEDTVRENNSTNVQMEENDAISIDMMNPLAGNDGNGGIQSRAAHVVDRRTVQEQDKRKNNASNKGDEKMNNQGKSTEKGKETNTNNSSGNKNKNNKRNNNKSPGKGSRHGNKGRR